MNIVLIIILGAVLQSYLPWWSALLPAFLIGGWFANQRREAIRNGSTGIGLLWLGYAGYLNWINEGILSTRIADMLGVPNGWIVLLITMVVGALTGAIGAWAGYELHELKDAQE